MTVASLFNITKILQSLCSFPAREALQLIREHSIWIAPSSAGLGSSGYTSVFLESLQFLPGMLKNQETADQESSWLKKLME
jgi:hypothetical protein